MTFPETPLDVLVEIDAGGWTDITDDVLLGDGIEISRGRPNEAATVDSSSCHLVLLNTEGKYSPRNPLGPYYGLIGRNTPIRVSVPSPTSFVYQPKGSTTACIVISDNAQVSVTGDIDIRIEFSIEDTSPESGLTTVGLASHYGTTGNNRGWVFMITADGRLQFTHSPTGLSGSTIDHFSTVLLPLTWSKQAVRVTMDVDNGASGHTVTFYTSDSISGTWTQLGDAVVTAGTTSIFDSAASLFVGYSQVAGARANVGRLYKFELRSGIGGTVVADPDCTVQTLGAATFEDTAASPNTWFVLNGAEIVDRDYRFVGEVNAWPPKWDLSGNVVKTSITAYGPLHRLDQGSKPVRSALFRFLSNPSLTSVVGYWSMEDKEGSTSIAGGRSGLTPGSIVGTPEIAAYSDYLASDPLPTLGGTSGFVFQVPFYTVNAGTSIRFFLNPTDSGPGAVARLVSVRTTGTAARWEVELSANGRSYQIRAYDVNGASLLTDGFNSVLTVDFGEPVFVNLQLTENGSDVDYNLQVYELGQIPAITTTLNRSGTLAGQTVRRVQSVMVGPSGGLGGLSVGHMTVLNTASIPSGITNAMGAHIGESASDRADRLSAEVGVSFSKLGFSEGTLMGAQISKEFSELLQECEDADLGQLFEPRQILGVGYRDVTSLMNQSPGLTLDYSASEAAGELEPVDDDRLTRNDITVERQLGSRFHVEQSTGPLSTQDPPDGVGRYEDSKQVSLATEDQLPDAAGWRLNLGTVDEPRYPQISVDLARNTGLTESTLRVDTGSRIVVTDLPVWVSYNDVSQIVQGYTERLENYKHYLTFNCAPESPYRVAQLDSDTLGHADTAGSELASGVTSTATSMSVATTLGPVWTTDGADFPFDAIVGGERITVTAISGASSPQTFTVTRSVNGVVKSHLSGADLKLWQRMTLAY